MSKNFGATQVRVAKPGERVGHTFDTVLPAEGLHVIGTAEDEKGPASRVHLLVQLRTGVVVDVSMGSRADVDQLIEALTLVREDVFAPKGEAPSA